MTRTEFIMQAVIAAYGKNPDAEDLALLWSDAERLAIAKPESLSWGSTAASASSGGGRSSAGGGGGGDGTCFPPFGKQAGSPIQGASDRTLRFYAGAAMRTLSDPGKSRWHDKERALLAAYVAEMQRQGFDVSEFVQREEPMPSRHAPKSPVVDDDGLPPF